MPLPIVGGAASEYQAFGDNCAFKKSHLGLLNLGAGGKYQKMPRIGTLHTAFKPSVE